VKTDFKEMKVAVLYRREQLNRDYSYLKKPGELLFFEMKRETTVVSKFIRNTNPYPMQRNAVSTAVKVITNALHVLVHSNILQFFVQTKQKH
jgi:hypothetical protein